LESGSRLAPGHTRENTAGGSETFRCGGSHPGMETTNNQEVRQAEKQPAHSPRFTSHSTSTSNQHRSPQSFMGSDSRLQHSEWGPITYAPISHLDDDIDSDENLQPPIIMSGPAPSAGVEALPAAPLQATSSAAPEAQATSTASPAGQATPSTAAAAASTPRASTTTTEGQAHIDATNDLTEPETTRIPKPCTQATDDSEVYTVIDFDGRFDATRRRGSLLGSSTNDRNITTSTARKKMFATTGKSRRARARNIVTLIAIRAVITQQQRRSEHRHLNGEKGGEYGFFKNTQEVARYRTTSTRRRTATRSNNDEEMFVRGGVSECDPQLRPKSSTNQ